MDGDVGRLSIIIPTYNERENVVSLVPEIAEALDREGIDWEIVVVDDASPDGTAEAARELSTSHPVEIIVRRGERGLSPAVLEGCARSRAGLLAVMDADHSHPPRALPAMLTAVRGGARLVVGSRHVPGGGIEDWPLRRRLMSRFAALLARGLTPVRDPTSGFLMFRREVIEGASLRPTGFKVGLEILVKGNHAGRIVEVPIRFADRRHGESKLTGLVVVQFLGHLMRLYVWKLQRLWSGAR